MQAPQELPPEIPRKDDKIPCDIAMPLKDEPAFDEDDEEEWHIEPEGSLISGGLKQIAEDPKGAADAAATEITENANMAAQVALEQSEHTHTLLKEGNWRGRSPAEYIVMVRSRPHWIMFTCILSFFVGVDCTIPAKASSQDISVHTWRYARNHDARISSMPTSICTIFLSYVVTHDLGESEAKFPLLCGAC